MKERLQEIKLFTSKYFKQRRRIGTISPSSVAIARAACKYINPMQPQTIIELGAGTGAITRVALNQMHPDSVLIAIESDEEFYAVLKTHCPRAKILLADVRDIKEQLDKININTIDYMISCVPIIPSTLVKTLDAFQRFAKNDAHFIQVSLVPWYYLKFYRQFFINVNFQFVFKNLPPAGVYFCSEINKDFQEKLNLLQKLSDAHVLFNI